MDHILQRPLFPKFAGLLNYVSTEIMTNGYPESGWTKYLDVSVDRRSEENTNGFELRGNK